MTRTDAEAPAPGRRTRLRAVLAVVAVIVFAVDQVTKQAAVALLEGRERIPVLGELAGFAFYRNPGAAFGIGGSTTWIFAVIAAVVFAVILVIGRGLGSTGWAWALGLLLGGLSGNLLDRIVRPPAPFHGAVVDFIDLSLFICNVADIAISTAAALIILLTLRGVGVDGRVEGKSESAAAAERSSQ